MKTLILAYSLTGNNAALADSLAAALSADCVKVTEQKARTCGSYVSEMFFGKSPLVTPNPETMDTYDRVILIGPVWLGKIASPLRTFLTHLKEHPKPYAFASINGGALGPNKNLDAELRNRTGSAPFALFDLHIADLLPTEPKPTTKDTSNYQITSADIERLTNLIVAGV